jgi:uncharacterized membrane protein YjjP (DUF1212 family)
MILILILIIAIIILLLYAGFWSVLILVIIGASVYAIIRFILNRSFNRRE